MEKYFKELSKQLNIKFIINYKNNLEELLVWMDAYQDGIGMEVPGGFNFIDLHNSYIFGYELSKLLISEDMISDHEFEKILNISGSITEEFIDKISDKLTNNEWKTISLCQPLSDQFIKKHREKLNQEMLNRNNKINSKWRWRRQVNNLIENDITNSLGRRNFTQSFRRNY